MMHICSIIFDRIPTHQLIHLKDSGIFYFSLVLSLSHKLLQIVLLLPYNRLSVLCNIQLQHLLLFSYFVPL